LLPVIPALGTVRRVATHIDNLGDAKRILIVGENSFEYSKNLKALKGRGFEIVATSLESASELRAKGFKVPRSSKGFTVRHGVDATKLNVDPRFTGRKFDAIIFNNPYAGMGDTVGTETRSLIERFIASGRGHLAEGGEVHINVTNRLRQKYPEVREVLVESTRRFGDSPYYAPHTPRYSTGAPMDFYRGHPERAEYLLNFVFK
jgi:hypothetical protein